MTLEAYERPADPPELHRCRPCQDAAKIQPLHDCDGGDCECPLCVQIGPIVRMMEEDWQRRDKEDSWPR